MVANQTALQPVRWIGVVFCMLSLVACSSHTAKRAGQGAATGAIAGAVGGLVTGLVFGGNVAESAARGAAWGASTGAVAGGIAGASETQAMEKQEQARNSKPQPTPSQRDAQIEHLKTDLGEDAFNGLAALAECKHEVALGHARTAAMSANQNYALAGLWIQILTYADRGEEAAARALFPDLTAKDPKINSDVQAEQKMRESLQQLMDIRAEYQLPRVCG